MRLLYSSLNSFLASSVSCVVSSINSSPSSKLPCKLPSESLHVLSSCLLNSVLTASKYLNLLSATIISAIRSHLPFLASACIPAWFLLNDISALAIKASIDFTASCCFLVKSFNVSCPSGDFDVSSYTTDKYSDTFF